MRVSRRVAGGRSDRIDAVLFIVTVSGARAARFNVADQMMRLVVNQIGDAEFRRDHAREIARFIDSQY